MTSIVLVMLVVILGLGIYYVYLQKNPDNIVAKKMKARFCKPSPTWSYPPRPPARIIVFPGDKDIGNLYTTTSGIGYVGSHGWELLGLARGEIVLPEGTAAFLEVKQGSSSILSSLDLNGIQMIDFSAPHEVPFELYTNNQTKRVVQLSDEDLKPLTKMKTLYRLVFHNTTITDKALTHITEVKSLRSVNLFNTKITDNGLQLLTQLPFLRGLDLGATDITDEGLRHLGKCTKLEKLNLTGSRRTKGNQSAGASSTNLNITDRGIGYLNDLLSLTELRIADTNVTDKSIEVLSQLKSLRFLDVSGTLMSEEGVKKLKVMLPDCRISDGRGITNR